MSDRHEKRRRHLENALDAYDTYIARGGKMTARHKETYAKLADTLDSMEERQDRRHMDRIGFDTGRPQRADRYDRYDRAVDDMRNTVAAIADILPDIVDDYRYDDMVARRGVPGTGPYGDPRKRRRRTPRRRTTRYEFDGDMHDEHYDIVDYDERTDRTMRYNPHVTPPHTDEFTPTTPQTRRGVPGTRQADSPVGPGNR